MKKVLLVIGFLLLVCFLNAQDRSYVFSDNGHWLSSNTNFVSFISVDSMFMNRHQTARIASATYPTVRISDDCKTVYFFDHYHLVKGTPHKQDFSGRDTVPGPPLDGKIIEFAGNGKYLLVSSTTMAGATPSALGLQNLLFYVLNSDRYELKDSVGLRLEGNYIIDADVSSNGLVVYRDTKNGWSSYMADENGHLKSSIIPMDRDYESIDIPSDGDAIYFTKYSIMAVSSVYQMRIASMVPVCIFRTTDVTTQNATPLSLSSNVSVSPDGKTIAVMLTETFNSRTAKISWAYSKQSIWMMQEENNGVSPAVRLSDVGMKVTDAWYTGNLEYTAITVTNKQIFCTRAEGTIVCFPHLAVPCAGLVLNPFLPGKPSSLVTVPRAYEYLATDTIAEGGIHIVHVPLTNSGTDTLTIYQDPANQIYLIDQPLPDGNAWSVNQRIPEVKGYSTPESETKILVPPGGKVTLAVVQRFFYSGEVVETVINTSGSWGNYLLVRGTAIRVGKPHDSNFFGYRTFPNGELMEVFLCDSVTDTYSFQRYSESGVMLMECQFDVAGNSTGFCFYENGKAAKLITRDGDTYTRTTYYPDGSTHAVNHFIDQRETGTAQRWYPDGSLMSEAKFRTHYVLNIFLYRVKFQVTKGSSAKYYKEYYPTGQLKYTAHYSLAGFRRGKWKYYGPDGSVRGVFNNHGHSTGNVDWLTQLPQLFYDGRLRSWYHGGGKF